MSKLKYYTINCKPSSQPLKFPTFQKVRKFFSNATNSNVFSILVKVKDLKIPETGAALFNKPTSSSNSVANTEEGNLIDGALEKETKPSITIYLFSVSHLSSHQ
uniref:Uncharacterized protein n=1 Tax=Strigops habroptila TaxID=2489341 RepID=A0A672UBM4_STRHB